MKNEDKYALVASARTGLADADSAIVRKLELDERATIGDALSRLLASAEKDEEILQATGIKEGLTGRGSAVIVVNGRQAQRNEPISAYIVKKQHILPDGTSKQYVALEIEVSEVQQGGGWTYRS